MKYYTADSYKGYTLIGKPYYNKSGKLVSMAGPSHAEELQPSVLSAEYVKARNSQFLYIIQRIHEAIKNDRKISFQYYQLNLNKERFLVHGYRMSYKSVTRKDGQEEYCQERGEEVEDFSHTFCVYAER